MYKYEKFNMKMAVSPLKYGLKTIAYLIILSFFNVEVSFGQENEKYNFSDSLFKKMSIEDLIQIREHYDIKAKELGTEEEKSFSKGMQLGEDFLGSDAADIAAKDKIYIRVAEYYVDDAYEKFSQENDEYEEKITEYDRLLSLYDKGKLKEEPKEPAIPQLDYSKAIELYDRLVEEYPASEYAADALYNKAFLFARMGQNGKSRRVYQEIINKYPDSRYAPESYIQLAEYYFNPREDKTEESQSIVELKKAIQLYKKILKYKDSKRYDEALYKLGWSYYKLAARDPQKYTYSIMYFMMVADDIEKAKKLDPRSKISTPDVRNEAIEYIGISFTDENYTTQGTDKARKMLEKIGGREYGPEIMASIGKTYQKVDKWEKSIYAYETLLDMYPMYVDAPEVQQRIINGFVEIHNDQKAYDARVNLYTKYGPSTEWYHTIDKSEENNKIDYLNKGYRLSENAMRTNLLLDLEKAQEAETANLSSTDQYQYFADNCAKYLEIFATDSNAYDINWSYAFALDTKLRNYDAAYEEYIQVSSDYLEDKHRHEAALYAISVADTLVEIKYGSQTNDSVQFNIADVAQMNPATLTPEENRLVEAYDNYIRLFPVGEYTASFLAQAGEIYYNHKKFAESKVYYQTLVKRFPKSEYKNLAMKSIMDAYFALGQFKDSEIIAKRIIADSEVPEEQRQFASERLAAAIFKSAEHLQEQGDYFAAANEFIRVYEETPNDKQFVEPALYNGGLNFEKAKDWENAIATFNLIATNFPESKLLAINSLERIGESYKELDQFENAGDTYLRIYNEHRDYEGAETALYNAGYYYKKGSAWQKAIESNNTYITAYPDQEFATDLFFANAELYLKMDNVPEANRIYDEFSRKYPNDPRTIRAHYERGKYFKENDLTAEAKEEFNRAIARSDQFRQEGKDYNPYMAGEAVHALADILHDEFVGVELRQPQSNIETQKALLKSTIKDLNAAYSKVLTFGSPRSFEAVYNIARSYEEFAQIYGQEEVDPNISEDKQFVIKKRINDETAQLYEKAVEEYRKVVDNIPVIAEKLEVDIFSEKEIAKTSALDTLGLEQDTTQLARAAEEDLTGKLAVKYFNKAKDKISKLLYTKASLTTENVYQALNVKLPGKDPVNDIIYKLTVLSKIAKPAIEKTIDSHVRNIEDAEAMEVSNKYVEESKRQILLTSNILAEEYEQLVFASFDEYRNTSDGIKYMVEQEYEAKNEAGLDYYALNNRAAQMVDFIKILSLEASTIYENTLVFAEEHNIENDLVKNTEDRMLRFAIEATDMMSEAADSALITRDFYRMRFDSTENYNYEDASLFYDEYNANFTDYSAEILDDAFQKRETYAISNLWANKLILKLIQLDPLTYSGSVEKDKLIIQTDNSWKTSIEYFEGEWTKIEFDDSNWKNAEIVYSTENPFEFLENDPPAIWYPQRMGTATTSKIDDSLSVNLRSDSLNKNIATDSLASADSTFNEAEAVSNLASLNADTTVFFRHAFELNGTPVDGEIYISADDDFRFYLNGEYILDDELDRFSAVDTVDFYTVETALKPGKNVVIVDVEDKDLTRNGLKFYGYFEIIPADVTAAAAAKAKVKKVKVDSVVLSRLNKLNKNRISPRKGN
jgi:tetratricopeptide (TPR) repeat protein